jgi:hypothetical protein
MSITHLFFDIGGVLGTNGWSTPQRRRAIERFGLDAAGWPTRPTGIWAAGLLAAIFLVRREEVAQPEPVEIPASQT